MSSILEQLATRKAAQVASNTAPDDTPTTSALAPNASNSSTTSAKLEQLGSVKEAPITGYKSLDLTQFVKSNGEMVKPDEDGYFVPKDQEEYDLLEYYAKRGMLVEYPASDKDN